VIDVTQPASDGEQAYARVELNEAAERRRFDSASAYSYLGVRPRHKVAAKFLELQARMRDVVS
jgi:hypothetical protein